MNDNIWYIGVVDMNFMSTTPCLLSSDEMLAWGEPQSKNYNLDNDTCCYCSYIWTNYNTDLKTDEDELEIELTTDLSMSHKASLGLTRS